MRGEVEIWDGDKLLHKESNLLVNGAGELLADIMTVSPSLSGIADHATSSILDASNYTIQAISFGKDASAYQYNAHALNSRRNLLYYSTPSAQGDDPNGQVYWNTTYTEVCSAPEILPPTQYENVPSSIAHALSVTDISTSGNGQLSLSFGSPWGATPSWSTSGGQDNWFCYSVYIKSPVPDEPFHPYPHTSTAPKNRPHIKLQLNGENWNNDGFAKARASTDPWFASPDFTTPSGVGIGFYTDNRGEATGGYSIDYWDEGAGIEEAGNGWYKVWTSVLAPVSGLSGVNIYFIPAGWEADPTGETSGGIYAYGQQLELGRWPTSRQFNNQGYEANNWDLSGSVLNRDHSPGAVTDNGTVRVVPPYGTSSYVPTNYLSSPPNPDSTRVEDGDTALFDTSSPLSGFNMGQNLNVIPYREQGSQLPNFLNLYPNDAAGLYYSFNVKEGQQFLDWRAALYGPTIYSFSGMGSLGPQAYYLGCYPEGSSTGGSNWALVSSLDNSAAYLYADNGTDPNFVSGTYNSIVNEASSMDVSGFVGKVYDAKNKVGDLPNPNLLAYTINTEDDPNLTFNTDLAGTWDSMFPGELGTFSSVLYTNPFGGPSSMIISGDAGGINQYAGIRQRRDSSNPNLRLPLFHATSSICFSVYVKEYDNASKACSSFMVNAYDNNNNLRSYIGQYKFVGGVPTLLLAPPDDVVSKVEDVGDGWYRVSIIVDGLQHSDTQENDTMQAVLYLSDIAADDEVNLRDKLLYWYAPQVEQHPTEYGITLPTPYQAVAGLTPTVAEQTGEGGLHVSGGVDATNSGTVEYSITIGSGDVGYSNLYGGIYNMGLWTIDMDESIKVGNTPPYSFGPLNNPRKYKLFSTKHLTKNLGFIEDNGTNAGSLNYSDLTIKWRLHFL